MYAENNHIISVFIDFQHVQEHRNICCFQEYTRMNTTNSIYSVDALMTNLEGHMKLARVEANISGERTVKKSDHSMLSTGKEKSMIDQEVRNVKYFYRSNVIV